MTLRHGGCGRAVGGRVGLLGVLGRWPVSGAAASLVFAPGRRRSGPSGTASEAAMAYHSGYGAHGAWGAGGRDAARPAEEGRRPAHPEGRGAESATQSGGGPSGLCSLPFANAAWTLPPRPSPHQALTAQLGPPFSVTVVLGSLTTARGHRVPSRLFSHPCSFADALPSQLQHLPSFPPAVQGPDLRARVWSPPGGQPLPDAASGPPLWASTSRQLPQFFFRHLTLPPEGPLIRAAAGAALPARVCFPAHWGSQDPHWAAIPRKGLCSSSDLVLPSFI